MQSKKLNRLGLFGTAVVLVAAGGACAGSSDGSTATLLRAGLDVSALNDSQIAQVTRECHQRRGDSDDRFDESLDGAMAAQDDDNDVDEADASSFDAMDGSGDADGSMDEHSRRHRSVNSICKEMFQRECHKHGDQRADDDAGRDDSDKHIDERGR